jgi:predicted naringenin-chalcone synthase
MKKISLIVLVVFGLFSCGKQTENVIELKNITLEAEGPYFEGPNTFQAAIKDVLKNNNIDPEKVESVELASATIFFTDSIEEGLIQDLSLQMVSNQSDMKKVAFINPLPSNQKEVVLTVATEQDGLNKIFSSDDFIMLLDANLKKDMETTLNFKANLTFKILTK